MFATNDDDLTEVLSDLFKLDEEFVRFVEKLHEILPRLEACVENAEKKNKKAKSALESIQGWHNRCWDTETGIAKDFDLVRVQIIRDNLMM